MKNIARYFLFLLVFAVVGTFLIASYFAFFRKGDVQDKKNVSSEFQDALFLSPENGLTKLYRLSNGQYENIPRGQGSSVQAVARQGEDIVEIQSLSNGDFSLVVNGVVVYSSQLPKMGGVFSSDKKFVAYMEAAENLPSDTKKEERKPLNWQIMIFEVASGNRTTIGTGLYPIFTDTSHVAWFSSQGIRVADFINGNVATVDSFSSNSLAFSPVQSPDGKLIAWADNTNRTVSVRSINSTSSLETIAAINTQGPFIALGNDALYNLVAGKEGGTDVLRYSFGGGEPTRVHHFDSIVTKLLP
ncbi:MAG: hypothetical protein AAB519_00270 [Patescibacteria group bacterium]